MAGQLYYDLGYFDLETRVLEPVENQAVEDQETQV
jgi:hypothetical protein